MRPGKFIFFRIAFYYDMKSRECYKILNFIYYKHAHYYLQFQTIFYKRIYTDKIFQKIKTYNVTPQLQMSTLKPGKDSKPFAISGG